MLAVVEAARRCAGLAPCGEGGMATFMRELRCAADCARLADDDDEEGGAPLAEGSMGELPPAPAALLLPAASGSVAIICPLEVEVSAGDGKMRQRDPGEHCRMAGCALVRTCAPSMAAACAATSSRTLARTVSLRHGLDRNALKPSAMQRLTSCFMVLAVTAITGSAVWPRLRSCCSASLPDKTG